MIPHQDINAELTQLGVVNPTDVTQFIPPRVHGEFAATYTNLMALVNDPTVWISSKKVIGMVEAVTEADTPVVHDLLRLLKETQGACSVTFVQVNTPKGPENVALVKKRCWS